MFVTFCPEHCRDMILTESADSGPGILKCKLARIVKVPTGSNCFCTGTEDMVAG